MTKEESARIYKALGFSFHEVTPEDIYKGQWWEPVMPSSLANGKSGYYRYPNGHVSHFLPEQGHQFFFDYAGPYLRARKIQYWGGWQHDGFFVGIVEPFELNTCHEQETLAEAWQKAFLKFLDSTEVLK